MPERNTRQAVIAAAARLYAERGYEGVSMRDVAAAVGVAPANLYHHFADKEALIAETLARVFADKARAMETALAEEGDPAARLRRFVAWFVRLLHDDPEFARLLTRELLDASPPRLERLAREVFARPFALLSETIARCSDHPDPAQAAVSTAALLLGRRLLGPGLAYLPGTAPDSAAPDLVIRHAAALLERALGIAPPAEGGTS